MGIPGNSPWLTLHDRPGSGVGVGAVAANAAAGWAASTAAPRTTELIPASVCLARMFIFLETSVR